jgi:hypothetical protein
MIAKKSLKILSVGNSFAMDTTEHAPKIALDLGFESVHMGTLYIGGCSINRHYGNAQANAQAYEYYVNDGDEWHKSLNVSIQDAINSEEWDFISIQHGTGDGSRYTRGESYENLALLVEYIREKAPSKAKIVFNMAWVMEPDSTHPEIRSYDGDQLLMYENLARITEQVVMPTKGIDIISPAGTAIQNARATGKLGKLCRDGFHLSYTKGRYLAALTFLCTLTSIGPRTLTSAIDGISDDELNIIVECAANAIKNPFRVTN